jgi:hypothetical protein
MLFLSIFILFKGIVSPDFGVLFMISLKSYEVRTGGRIRFIFHLMPFSFSYLDLIKIGLDGKKTRIMNPQTVTVRRISRNTCCQPRLPVTANVAVRGNSVYKVILPRSTSSRMRNPPEEWLPRMFQFAVTLYCI